ncbi:MAG: DUF4190 domain-containing protein [Jatrophihabitans sp.]|uniref:DUF4190 domain-containing protein n=1 Tax=Jatrophihabitans sp. TaxID=1932789 RepID=UPI00391024CB
MAYPNAPEAAPRAGTRSNGLAIASLVCGIVGLLVFAIILGPLAIIFGGVGLSRAKAGAGHRGMAIAGMVLGIIDVVVFAILLAAASKHGGSMYVHFG